MAKTKKTKKVSKSKISSFAQHRIDFVMALLIVSLLFNLFVLVGWVTLQVTDMYDQQVADFLFKN